MNLIDDRILEILVDEDRQMSPTEIADYHHINFHPAYIGRRFSKLREAGLVRKTHPNKALYEVTDKGRAYLNEEYDVEAGMYVDDMNGNGETNINADEKA
ncbi:winged helix-turn-helix domain-containing protein [Halarchaeum sp. P4]|uniref:winged helix-turn-helix domain-containing protein n=1 Tax=Halarchaeum sp. P4 TaxID=3421639 RepID=UPI003EBAA7B8